jgi:hypothetical protein
MFFLFTIVMLEDFVILMGWCNRLFSWSQLSCWNILWFWWVGTTSLSCLQLLCWRNFVILMICYNRFVISWSQLSCWSILWFWWVGMTGSFLIATVMSPQLSCLLAFCINFSRVYLPLHPQEKWEHTCLKYELQGYTPWKPLISGDLVRTHNALYPIIKNL